MQPLPSAASRVSPILILLFTLILALSACNLPQKTSVPNATPTPPGAAALGQSAASTLEPGATMTPAFTMTLTPSPSETLTPTIEHKVVPPSPPASHESGMSDSDSSLTANDQRASGGEFFNNSLYERPFNANSMDTYFPDLDIQRAYLSRADAWVFVTISLKGPMGDQGLGGVYGVELDLNVDGRGDYLVAAGAPGVDWSTDHVMVWKDSNLNVGGSAPIAADKAPGDGYETLVFDQGKGEDPDLAWGRLSPKIANSVEIAFKYSLIQNDAAFMWGAWTWGNPDLVKPEWFDYNDHFTIDQAGSPLKDQPKYYPLKALAEVDNTCRWTVGFTPKGNEPGVCTVPATPTPTATITSTPIPPSVTATRTKVIRTIIIFPKVTPTETQVLIK